jgi:hypothetical protein
MQAYRRYALWQMLHLMLKKKSLVQPFSVNGRSASGSQTRS